MNYVELVNKVESLSRELNQAQTDRIEAARSIPSLEIGEAISPEVDCRIEANGVDPLRIMIANNHEDGTTSFASLTVEEFNKIGMFLQKYNDAIYSLVNRTEEAAE